MRGISGYQWLRSLHVIAAVTWVGGNISLQILASRIRREGDPTKVFEMTGP